MNSHIQKNICRLCLQICDHYELIETTTREILNAIFPKLNLDISNEPVICDKCTLNLKKSISFKSMAYTQVCFAPFTKQENVTVDPQTVCGMCMNLVKTGFFIPLDNVDEEGIFQRIMLEECLPDLNLTTTKNPVICTSCNKSLKSHYNFVTECSKVERYIKLYCETEGINGGKITLNNVRKFVYRGMYCAADSYIVEEEHCKDQEKNDELEIEIKPDIEITESDIVSEAEEKFDINADQHDSSQIRMIFQQLEVDVNSSTRETTSALKIHESYSARPKKNRSHQESSSGITKQDNYLDKAEDNTGIEKFKITHKNMSEKIIYKCQTCIYTTNCEDSLTQHMLTHTERIILYPCEFCSFQSKRKGVLERHELIHKNPSEITIHQCNYCSYSTKYKGILKKHLQTCKASLLRTKPNNITVHQCNYCSYSTKYECNLKTHLKRCKTALPRTKSNKATVHSCKYCSYSTKYECNLKTHLRTCKTALLRTKADKATVHSCKYCSYSTKYECNLKRHLRTCKTALLRTKSNKGTVYPCKYCSYSTIFKCNLKKHLRTCKTALIRAKPKKHSAEAFMSRDKQMDQWNPNVRTPDHKYKCKSCSFQTIYKFGLNRHMLLHKDRSEVSMCKCEYCPYESPYIWNLVKHTKKIHSKIDREIAS